MNCLAIFHHAGVMMFIQVRLDVQGATVIAHEATRQALERASTGGKLEAEVGPTGQKRVLLHSALRSGSD